MYIYKAYYQPRAHEYFFKSKPKNGSLLKCERDDYENLKDFLDRLAWDWEITKIYVRK